MPEKQIAIGEVWFVEFPLEEDVSKFTNRPVIVLDVERLKVLSVKVTSHEARKSDSYDVPLLYWKEANLHLKSTARISKTFVLDKENFIFRIGTLDERDFKTIQEMYVKYIQEQ